MAKQYSDFATSLLEEACYEAVEKHSNNTCITIPRTGEDWAVLDLTPFATTAQEPTAARYFESVSSYDQLQQAYQAVRADYEFESDNEMAMAHVSPYAQRYLDKVFMQARDFIDSNQARLIARWVSTLDAYTSVKAVESLLNSKADLTLLNIAQQYGWTVLFDHLAIRCGSQTNGDAERVVEMLKNHHGYVSAQLAHESFYEFPEGWNAFPLYKILNNGQVLRVFVDQSATNRPDQIIQHWNRVYGYTAHHLAIRATHLQDGKRTAVALEDIVQALAEEGVESMTATGQYTSGLLVQVFTRPEKDLAIPAELKQQIEDRAPGLSKTVENAKLLEVVSRREMSAQKAKAFFELYQIAYDANNPLHSAPLYQYFLPAQAAHVIKTSVQT